MDIHGDLNSHGEQEMGAHDEDGEGDMQQISKWDGDEGHVPTLMGTHCHL